MPPPRCVGKKIQEDFIQSLVAFFYSNTCLCYIICLYTRFYSATEHPRTGHPRSGNPNQDQFVGGAGPSEVDNLYTKSGFHKPHCLNPPTRNPFLTHFVIKGRPLADLGCRLHALRPLGYEPDSVVSLSYLVHEKMRHCRNRYNLYSY